MKIICGIYKITSPIGKIYIGQSKDIYSTWQVRYKNCKCYRQRYLYHSIKKYGWDAHKKEVIHQIETYNQDELNKLEEYYGELYNCNNPKYGLNLRKCGGNRGAHSEESKERGSLAHIRWGVKMKCGIPMKRKKIIKQIKMSISKMGSKNGMFGKIPNNAIPVEQYSTNGIFLKSFKSIMAAAKEINLDFRLISLVCNGKRRRTGGFIFKKSI